MNLTPSKIPRREMAYNTYWRLKQAELDELVKNDWAAYLEHCAVTNETPMPETSRRNKFLSAKLKTESEEVQREVEEARLDAASKKIAKEVATLKDFKGELTEEARSKAAAGLQE
jgi:arginine/lysine/ornithine decarboxylase